MNRFEWVEYLCCGICMWWIGNETIEPCLWPSHPCPPAACAYKVGHFYHDTCALHGIEHMHSNSTDNDGCWESEYGKLYISSARMAIQKLEGCSWRRINMHPIRKWDRLDVCVCASVWKKWRGWKNPVESYAGGALLFELCQSFHVKCTHCSDWIKWMKSLVVIWNSNETEGQWVSHCI